MEPKIVITDLEKMSGTSLYGYIIVPYAKIVKLLGKPNSDGDGYKVDAQWVIEIDGTVFTIYNYKDGKNYNGQHGIATTKITEWHIGAADRNEVTAEAAKFLASKLGKIS